MNAQRRSVVTIGVFDGVHAGHRFVIAQALQHATALDARLVVASFDPHPASVLRPNDFLGLLTLPARRAELLKQEGADVVEFLKFDDQLRNLTPDEFVERILVEQLGADVVVIGKNFKFGRKAAGDIETLRSLSTKYGFEVEVIELKGDDSVWSSSRIRSLLLEGEVAKAHQLLGRLHRLTGTVVHGEKRGRELGYPTANLAVLGNCLIPADGVYAGLLTTADEVLPAAISIGTNPTFSDVLNRRVEAYVIDRTDLDLYDQQVHLDFIAKIRGMQAFSDVASLIRAMDGDIANARKEIDDFLEVSGH